MNASAAGPPPPRLAAGVALAHAAPAASAGQRSCRQPCRCRHGRQRRRRRQPCRRWRRVGTGAGRPRPVRRHRADPAAGLAGAPRRPGAPLARAAR
ncbi:hypothetical protein ACU4GD_01835 [Cupriavidus basilensis]